MCIAFRMPWWWYRISCLAWPSRNSQFNPNQRSCAGFRSLRLTVPDAHATMQAGAPPRPDRRAVPAKFCRNVIL